MAAYDSLQYVQRPPIKEGWLHKAASAKRKDECRNRWRKRYFVLRRQKLEYFKKKEDFEKRNKAKGEIDLNNAKIDVVVDEKIVSGKKFCFKVFQYEKQIYTYIQAARQDEREEWVYYLQKAAKYGTTSLWSTKLEKPPWLVDRQSISEGTGTPEDLKRSDSTVSGKKLERSASQQIKGKFASSPGATSGRPASANGIDTKYGDSIRSASAIRSSERVASTMTRSQSSASHRRTESEWASGKQSSIARLTEVDSFSHTSISKEGSRATTPSESRNSDVSVSKKKRRAFPVPQADTLEAGEDSYVLAWGAGPNGQLGTERNEIQLGPVLIPGLEKKKIRSIAVGRSHAGAVTERGLVYMWGKNDKVQLGLGLQLIECNTPQIVSALTKDPIHILACGHAHTLALSKTGVVYSWGAGELGQLGHRSTLSEPLPRMVEKFAKHKCRYVAAGGDSSAAIVNEHLCTWGDNSFGQLGTKTNMNRDSPIAVTTLTATGRRIRQIAVGVGFLAIVMENGKLYTCGSNSHGQLGYWGPYFMNSPTEVKKIGQLRSKCLSVSLGETHMVALVEAVDGTTSALTWGSVTKTAKAPTLDVLPYVSFVSASSSHSFVLYDDGGKGKRLWGAGTNQHGQLGTGNVLEPKPPQPYAKCALSSRCRLVQVECGLCFTIALCRGEPPVEGITEGVIEKYKRTEAEEKDEKEREVVASDEIRRVQSERKLDRKKKTDEPQRPGSRPDSAQGRSHVRSATSIDVRSKHCIVSGCHAERTQGPYCGTHFLETQQPLPGRKVVDQTGYGSGPDVEVLPPDWKKVRDPQSGRWYYVNPKTMESQWTRPVAAVTSPLTQYPRYHHSRSSSLQNTTPSPSQLPTPTASASVSPLTSAEPSPHNGMSFSYSSASSSASAGHYGFSSSSDRKIASQKSHHRQGSGSSRISFHETHETHEPEETSPEYQQTTGYEVYPSGPASIPTGAEYDIGQSTETSPEEIATDSGILSGSTDETGTGDGSGFEVVVSEPEPVVPKEPTEILPSGWHKELDPKSGRFYYYNNSTGQRQWRPPVGTVHGYA